MDGIWMFLKQYWLTITLIAGVVIAVYKVYKEKSKLMPEEDGPP
ncbi:hypothetical protein ACFFK0_13050 [Paenibacillus chartarius]|uniref:Uncharacterized protein n=1 Tax=Paenibacillus chartarius TaxID=747481 RepID=A0ABV6DL38_9BACL